MAYRHYRAGQMTALDPSGTVRIAPEKYTDKQKTEWLAGRDSMVDFINRSQGRDTYRKILAFKNQQDTP